MYLESGSDSPTKWTEHMHNDWDPSTFQTQKTTIVNTEDYNNLEEKLVGQKKLVLFCNYPAIFWKLSAINERKSLRVYHLILSATIFCQQGSPRLLLLLFKLLSRQIFLKLQEHVQSRVFQKENFGDSESRGS